MNSLALPRPFYVRVLSIGFLLLAPFSCQAVDLSGCWSGTWQSCVTGHRGPLHAKFVRMDANRYEVFLNGRFIKIMPFRYSVVMTASEQDGVIYLSGSQYLGRIFGTFAFTAAASDGQFNANYSSCKDDGLFKLCRCSHAPICDK